MICIIAVMLLPLCIHLFIMLITGKPTDDCEIELDGVSLILIAHNEEGNIERKVEELLRELRSVEPIKNELIVISDGSTDQTNFLLKPYEKLSNVRLLKLEQRKGKPFAINMAKSVSQYETLFFSDVRQLIGLNCLRSLLEEIKLDHVSAVSTTLRQKGKNSLVRRVLNLSKSVQSKSGNLMGVYGAFYGIKKSWLPDLRTDIILDDLYISLHVLAAGGKIKQLNTAEVIDLSFKNFYPKRRVLRLCCGLKQIIQDDSLGIMQLPWRLKLSFFMCKCYKFLLPFLFIMAVVISDYSSSFKIVFLVLICSLSSIRSLIKITAVCAVNFFEMGKYSSIKWEQIGSVRE